MKTGTAVAKTHRQKFLDYAETHNILVNVENLELWDAQHNHLALSKEIEAKYGKEYIYARGLKDLLRQYLHSEIFKMKANEPSNPVGFKISGLQPTGVIKRGVDIRTAPQEKMSVLIDAQKQRVENAVRLLKFYKLPVEKIHAWIDKVYED